MARIPVVPTVAPQTRVPFVSVSDKDGGLLTEAAKQFLQRLYNQTLGCCRIIPCDATNVSNAYTLTMGTVQPVYAAYADGDMFSFIAPATSTGLVTASVAPATGPLATLRVFKTNGTQANAGDIFANGQFYLTFTNSLAAGGALILR